MNRQQEFLQSFFQGEGYEEKEVNGFWLVKQISGITKETMVGVYTQESFKLYKDFGQKHLVKLKNRIEKKKIKNELHQKKKTAYLLSRKLPKSERTRRWEEKSRERLNKMSIFL